MKTMATEVLVVGGGATGAGTFRDLCMRGIDTILVEKGDLNHGTSGRNHGLLHSGARYTVKDQESARECIAENKILRKIARHTVEDTGGLFILLPEDDENYYQKFIISLKDNGIPFSELNQKETLQAEPSVNPAVLKSVLVPDGTIDPFRLVATNALDGVLHGGKVMTGVEVKEIRKSDNKVTSAICYDYKNNQQIEIKCNIIVNAAGIWGKNLLTMAGISLEMLPSGGSMLIVDYRINHMVVNRCRMPGNGDIIVPGDTVSIIGTTSKKTPETEYETNPVSREEVETLLEEGAKLIPGIIKARLLRAYGGVRPLVSSGSSDGRNISRGIILIDHAKDNVENIISITGGKLMTYRLMAEQTADLVLQKLNRSSICRTAETPLPGSLSIPNLSALAKTYKDLNITVTGATIARHGDRTNDILKSGREKLKPLCECEMVTQAEIEYAMKELFADDLHAIRRRTRMGMGPCQGTFCTIKTAGILMNNGNTPKEAEDNIRSFMEERWKGIRPVLSGDTLREAELTQWVYKSLQGMAEDDL